jgi:hypothetical protein
MEHRVNPAMVGEAGLINVGCDHGTEVAIHGGFVTGMVGASGGVEVPDRASAAARPFAVLLVPMRVQIRFRSRTERFGDQTVRFLAILVDDRDV